MALNANALTSLAEAKVLLDIPTTSQDSYLERLINVASMQIERHCNRKLVSQAHVDTFDGTSSNQLVLPQYPVTAIAGVWVDQTRAFGSDTQLETSEYSDSTEDLQQGLLRLVSGAFGRGVRNVKVSYTAGYVTISEEAPDLEQACLWLVELMYRARSDRRLGRQSITKGEESVDYLSQWPVEILTLLEPYRREFFNPGSISRVV